jgi:hypothetical protein
MPWLAGQERKNSYAVPVAVFISDSSADEATRESVIARIAKAAWDWDSSAQQPATK